MNEFRMERTSASGSILKTSLLKGMGLGIGFGIGLTTTALIAAAASMNLFSSGEVISSAKLNENFEIAAPEGAVISFNLAECPKGWAPADGNDGTPDLRGRFVRGRDDAGTGAAGRDPDGVRGLGGYQPDAFQGHAHAPQTGYFWIILDGAGVAGPAFGSSIQTIHSTTGGAVSDGTHGSPRIASETRPKNVALVYCMRKNAP
ncbi:Tail Collar domain protein [Leptonema illini DSM 21528]|uniref:Tail Collar domain protein n=2 Tax=Leptonema illini TaxID=183 RepID=H2CGW6_9LEPT|nr:Tail Collar domain protein [Leptonema illini DSM 21528]